MSPVSLTVERPQKAWKENAVKISTLTGTFKVLQDVAFLKGQGLFLLLIQHAVNRDEFVIERYDIGEAHSRPNHIL